MTIYIKFDSDDDFKWLHYTVSRSIERIKNAPFGTYPEDLIETVANISESLGSPLIPEVELKPAVLEEVLKTPRKKRTVNTASKDVVKLTLCATHSNYTAQRSPRTECKDCWAVYEKLNPNKAAVAKRTFKRKTTNK